MLLISLVLGLIPLLGIAWIVISGTLTTQDGLFTILILLTMSGVFMINVMMELRDRGLIPFLPAKVDPDAPARQRSNTAPGATVPASAALAASRTEVGLIESVQFFEALVGQMNRSIIALRPEGAADPRFITLCGNVRDQLTVGRKVSITYSPAGECNNLLAVN